MRLRQRYLPEEVETSPGYKVEPGVVELLDRLADDGVLLGLTTGNTEAAAHTKLARADLNHYFAFGGYGSDAADRTELHARPRSSAPAPRRRAASRTRRSSPSATRRATSRRATAPGSGSSASRAASTASSELRDAGADWAIRVARGGPARCERRRLAGDVGGTHARLALFADPTEQPEATEIYPSADAEGLAPCRRRLPEGSIPPSRSRPRLASPVRCATAAPRRSTSPWPVDAAELREHLGIESVAVINDLEANAWGIPALRADDLHVLAKGEPVAGGAIALISAGHRARRGVRHL